MLVKEIPVICIAQNFSLFLDGYCKNFTCNLEILYKVYNIHPSDSIFDELNIRLLEYVGIRYIDLPKIIKENNNILSCFFLLNESENQYLTSMYDIPESVEIDIINKIKKHRQKYGFSVNKLLLKKFSEILPKIQNTQHKDINKLMIYFSEILLWGEMGINEYNLLLASIPTELLLDEFIINIINKGIKIYKGYINLSIIVKYLSNKELNHSFIHEYIDNRIIKKLALINKLDLLVPTYKFITVGVIDFLYDTKYSSSNFDNFDTEIVPEDILEDTLSFYNPKYRHIYPPSFDQKIKDIENNTYKYNYKKNKRYESYIEQEKHRCIYFPTDMNQYKNETKIDRIPIQYLKERYKDGDIRSYHIEKKLFDYTNDEKYINGYYYNSKTPIYKLNNFVISRKTIYELSKDYEWDNFITFGTADVSVLNFIPIVHLDKISFSSVYDIVCYHNERTVNILGEKNNHTDYWYYKIVYSHIIKRNNTSLILSKLNKNQYTTDRVAKVIVGNLHELRYYYYNIYKLIHIKKLLRK